MPRGKGDVNTRMNGGSSGTIGRRRRAWKTVVITVVVDKSNRVVVGLSISKLCMVSLHGRSIGGRWSSVLELWVHHP